ncbi:MAG: hypothetical protein JW724_00020 [Candidatus Altiarchaeota archaeon]|nr:hypothetical protein [Candidatus Altiarchaeota archaeon]
MKKSLCILLLLSTAFFITPAAARYITLQHTSVYKESPVAGNETQIRLNMVNTGDEAAYEVELSLMLPEGITSDYMSLGRVDPRIPQSGEFNLKISPEIKPGKYSIAILTEYRDANGYAFSSVSPNDLVIKEGRPSQVTGMIPEISLGDKGGKEKPALTLRNMDQKSHEVKVKIFAPKELSIVPYENSLSIDARDGTVVEFEVSSFGALKGSNYIVFASMDYEDDGMHYSSIASGMVKVVEQTEAISFGGWIPIAAAAVLVLAFIAYQFIKK